MCAICLGCGDWGTSASVVDHIDGVALSIGGISNIPDINFITGACQTWDDDDVASC